MTTTILTIDTSATSVVGLARWADGPLDEVYTVSDDARHHVETLAPMVRQILTDAGVDKPDMIIVGRGPGAFTGLRAGVITARALAEAWQVPLYGVPSLDALAVAAGDRGAQIIQPVIDARRREVFTVRTRTLGPDDTLPAGTPEAIAPAELAARLAEDPAIVVTNMPGADDLFPGVDVLHENVRPLVLARLVMSRLGRIDAGEEGVTLESEPIYVRRPDIHGA